MLPVLTDGMHLLNIVKRIFLRIWILNFIGVTHSHVISIDCTATDYVTGWNVSVTCTLSSDEDTQTAKLEITRYPFQGSTGSDVLDCQGIHKCQAGKGWTYVAQGTSFEVTTSNATKEVEGIYFCKTLPDKETQKKSCNLTINGSIAGAKDSGPNLSREACIALGVCVPLVLLLVVLIVAWLCWRRFNTRKENHNTHANGPSEGLQQIGSTSTDEGSRGKTEVERRRRSTSTDEGSRGKTEVERRRRTLLHSNNRGSTSQHSNSVITPGSEVDGGPVQSLQNESREPSMLPCGNCMGESSSAGHSHSPLLASQGDGSSDQVNTQKGHVAKMVSLYNAPLATGE